MCPVTEMTTITNGNASSGQQLTASSADCSATPCLPSRLAAVPSRNDKLLYCTLIADEDDRVNWHYAAVNTTIPTLSKS